MLIKCPECGKEISDKSKQCIYCGCPIDNRDNNCIINNRDNNCIINNREYDLTQELQMILSNSGLANVIISLRMKCELSSADAKKLYDIINETKKIPDNFSCEMRYIPKCPTCGSTDIKPAGILDYIYTTSYGTNTISFICKNCGYKW